MKRTANWTAYGCDFRGIVDGYVLKFDQRTRESTVLAVIVPEGGGQPHVVDVHDLLFDAPDTQVARAQVTRAHPGMHSC